MSAPNGCADLDPNWPDASGRPRGPVLCVLYPDCKCGKQSLEEYEFVVTAEPATHTGHDGMQHNGKSRECCGKCSGLGE